MFSMRYSAHYEPLEADETEARSLLSHDAKQMQANMKKRRRSWRRRHGAQTKTRKPVEPPAARGKKLPTIPLNPHDMTVLDAILTSYLAYLRGAVVVSRKHAD